MLLWFVFAALTAAAIVAVSLPFVRMRRDEQFDPNADAAVYRAQLAEIDSDEERGILDKQEAEAARVEISRRLLRAADSAGAAESSSLVPSQKYRRAVLISLFAIVPTVALTLYLSFGSPQLPELPEQPLAARSIAALVAKVEERLREHPEDGAGWDVIAPVYFRMQRFDEAADAFERAIRLNGESVKRLEGLAEALVMSNNGIVSEKARAAFARALAKDAGLPKSRFWLAMAKEQEGKLSEAAKAYKELLAQSPEGAPWRGLVNQRLTLVQSRLAAAEKAADAPGPTTEDVRAAEKMSTEDRSAMINQMVAKLAERLKVDGSDLQGWLRLMRAYMVLGKTDAAKQAAADARQNFAGNEQALAQIDAAVKQLGLGS